MGLFHSILDEARRYAAESQRKASLSQIEYFRQEGEKALQKRRDEIAHGREAFARLKAK